MISLKDWTKQSGSRWDWRGRRGTRSSQACEVTARVAVSPVRAVGNILVHRVTQFSSCSKRPRSHCNSVILKPGSCWNHWGSGAWKQDAVPCLPLQSRGVTASGVGPSLGSPVELPPASNRKLGLRTPLRTMEEVHLNKSTCVTGAGAGFPAALKVTAPTAGIIKNHVNRSKRPAREREMFRCPLNQTQTPEEFVHLSAQVLRG